jgi:hypothetical protein
MGIALKKAVRWETLSSSLFAKISKKKREVAARWADSVSSGSGDPELLVPSRINKTLQKAITQPANQCYLDHKTLFNFHQTATKGQAGSHRHQGP